MVSCNITGMQANASDERYLRLTFRNNTTESFSDFEQIIDAASEGTTYNNLIMSFIMKLDYGTKYNFAVGSQDTGDLSIADVSGNSVYFYRISDER